MKLEEVSFSGYKAFADGSFEGGPLQVFKLAPLTVVFGKNNSGKSAIVRLPLLLLGGMACEDDRILPLESRGLRFGGRFVDLIHGGDYITRPTFGLKARLDDEQLDLTAKLFVTATNPDAPPKLWSYQMRSPEVLSLETPSLGQKGLLPATEAFRKWREAAAETLKQTIHLGPMRSRISSSFSVEAPSWTGSEGHSAPQWLRLDPELADETEKWFAQNLEGWRLSVDRSLETFSLRVSKSQRMAANLAYAGEGLQQVLPVIVHQLWRQQKRGSGFLDIVEQPELHLHDAAHAALTDLYVETAKQGNGQTLVETHSKPFLLRLQRRVAEGLLASETVAIYFVDESATGSSLRRIGLTPDGDLEEWPAGVFEEDFREVAAISRAQRQREAKP